MTWANPVFLLFAVLTLLALSPLFYSLWRAGTPRGRRDSALALHRAQLEELDRERAEGRIAPTEHAAARLEVQRRLLAAADLTDELAPRSAKMPLIVALILVPLAGEALYFISGQPDMPSGAAAPKEPTTAEAQEAERLISTLRTKLAELDPKTQIAGQGYLLLGNAEMSRGHIGEAASAWRTALEAGFNPALAAQAAEAQYEADGKMTDATRDLFNRALAEAPPDASWKALAQQRIGEK